MQQPKTRNQDDTQDELLVHVDEAERVIEDLPKTDISSKFSIVKYQGFWCPNHSNYMASILYFQQHFCARDTDLIIGSFPKTGTTWLKSLLFSVVNREKYGIKQSPLLNNHPHELVYRLEIDVYGNAFDYPRPHHLNELPSPRLLHTHLPYVSLPDSIKDSGCKVLYISRNPMDTLVSQWYFMISALKKMEGEDFEFFSMEEFFEFFLQGKLVHGPFFDHVVEYWKESLERPEKVLFLKYEDLKDDPIVELKKLAEFVGVPFSPKEESEGVIKEIIEFCSIGNLKEMEVNKSGVFNKFYEKKSYFRKGEVGDWTQYFTPSMVERMNKLMKEKFEDIGLFFKLGY
ncbi:cytosolic sulfotransferase 5-like [Silene latifolia]|uniref:cytosolic sulfotransferase 5-like n=1 Tax=Silene latifolia TaxID=37657 RepID=UPI003D787FB1